jgi:CRISPR-associated endonuclease/helicase Cas3
MNAARTAENKPLPDLRDILRFWGKARPQPGAGVAWHPLACHSLDVAAAMAALLAARPGWLKAVADATCLAEQEARKRLILTAALHDLGKFAENFQGKVPELAQALGHDPAYAAARDGHGAVGAALWERRISRALDLGALDDWLYASVSHHGTPVQPTGNLKDVMSEDAVAAALAFATAATALIGRPDATRPAGRQQEHWRVAGLVILADWIGSNQAYFPYVSGIASLAAYWQTAQKQAAEAVRAFGLHEAASAAVFDLRSLLSGATASPLQAWAERQAPVSGPQLYLIEDLTGAGKTEAGLILCHRLMQTGNAEGIYWALPSMATANALYTRLAGTYQRLFDPAGCVPSLMLAHSARDLHTAFQASIRTNMTPALSCYPASDHERTAEAACAAFLAEDRKKTFLAQVGVGTLDQALLAVLPVRHQALRLAALSRRVLVVDEAHAYDAYMTRGLEQLLQFQAALGGSAVILSATLTHDQKQRFARAYGAAPASLASTAFPLTTRIADRTVCEEPHPSARGTRRDLPVRRFATPDAVMEALLEQAQAGRCGVYIRNTVAEALEAFEALRGRWNKVDIFHARFCLQDRLAREQAVLARFGKTSQPAERQGQLLVATQVVEQSLDLDFDVMATDLCPMDLLIQRAGRLHRHDRGERPAPELWVVADAATDAVGADWYAKLFPAGQYVYPDVGQLWRTQRVLEAAGGLNLASGSPRDLIEPVFGRDAIDIPATLETQTGKAEGQRQSDRGVAGLNFLQLRDFDASKDSWASDVHTPARLGDETRVLRLARWQDGVLQPWARAETPEQAWRLSEISVRRTRCKEPTPPDAAAAAAIAAVMQSWDERDDPTPVLALVPAEQTGGWVGRWMDPQGRLVEVRYTAGRGLHIM